MRVLWHDLLLLLLVPDLLNELDELRGLLVVGADVQHLETMPRPARLRSLRQVRCSAKCPQVDGWVMLELRHHTQYIKSNAFQVDCRQLQQINNSPSNPANQFACTLQCCLPWFCMVSEMIQ